MQTPVTTTTDNTSKQEDGTSSNTDQDDGTTVTVPPQVEHTGKLQQPLAGAAQADVLMTSQLETVQRDLQSILHRLNSLELLLKRRRVRKCSL